MNAQSPIGPEDVLAIIRERTARGFGRAPLALPPAPGPFRATPLAGLVRGVAPEEAALPVAEPDPAPPPTPPANPEPDLAERLTAARAEAWNEGHAKGHAAGREAGRAEAEADLARARAAFETAAARLAAPSATDTAHLAQAIDAAVRALAAQRAGIAIDDHPQAFALRIAALADRVAQGLRQVSLRLNPEDLATLAPHLGAFDLLAEARVLPDPRLARGDVEIHAEGIVLADLLEGTP